MSWRAPPLLLLPLLLGGCSLAQTSVLPCAEAVDCRSAFGRGWVCGAEGFCLEEPLIERCAEATVDTVEVGPNDPEPIWLATVFDQGESMPRVRAARLAAIEVNRREGVNGRRVRLIECDNDPSVGDTRQSAEATEFVTAHLVGAQGVHAIVGPSTSSDAEVVYRVASAAGTLVVTPSASSPALTSLDGLSSTDEAPGLLWRTTPPDTLQGRVAALEIIAAGVVDVAVIYETGAYGDGLSEVFQVNWAGAGRDLGLYPFADTTDLSAAVVDAAEQGHDSVLFISSHIADGASFLNAAGAVAGDPYAGLPIFMSDGSFDSQLMDGTRGAPGELLWGQIRGTVPSTPSGRAFNTFVAGYRAEFGGENPEEFGFTAHSYDALWLTLAGSAWADLQGLPISGLNTARGFRRVSDASSGAPIDLGPNAWTDIQDRFAAGQSIDLQGASGSLDFDAETGETSGPTDVWTIAPGGQEFVIEYCVDLSVTPSADCCTDPTDPAQDCEAVR